MSISQNYGNIKPSLNLDFANVKKLDPRVTFARASTARYYDGKSVAKAEENLVLYSQEFDNGIWTKLGSSTVTGNSTAAPDGTTTADTLNGAVGSTYIIQNFTPTSGLTYGFSVFAKANTTNFLQVAAGSTTFGVNVWANFDLSAGTVGTAGSSTTASIQSVGNGWYRCVIIGDATASTSGNTFALIPVESSTAARFPTNAGVTSIYLWGAQLEQRSQATAYQPTTTQPITNYIPVLQTASANVARFDHDPVTGESLGLLVEEQRTNLVTYSEDFSNAAWTKSRSSIEANTVVAPDGALTGDKLVANSDNNTHYIYQASTVVSGTTYTGYCYVKSGEYTKISLRLQALSGSADVTSDFDLVAKTATGSGVIKEMANGYFRCSLSFTPDTTSSRFYVYSLDNTGASSFTGDGYSGIYIWGAQLEAGAFPTSYIPTVASQVTRSADAASMTGTNFSEWFSNAEGTIYSEITAAATAFGVFLADGTSGSNSLYTRIAASGPSFAVVTNGVTQANIGASSLTAKIANAYKINDFATSVNGGSVSTDTSGIAPVVNALGIGSTTSPSLLINGTIKKIAFFPKRLSNVQLQSLTS